MKKYLLLTLAALASIGASADELKYRLVDMAGNVYEGSYEGTVGTTEPTFEGVYYKLDKISWDGNKFQASIDFHVPVSKENGTLNSTLITQSGWVSNRYDDYGREITTYKNWHAVNGGVKVEESKPHIDDIAAWMWAIYPKHDAKSNTFSLYIKNLYADKYLYVNPATVLKENKGKYGTFNVEGAVQLKNEGTAFSSRMVEGDFLFCFDFRKGENVYHMHFGVNKAASKDEWLGFSNLEDRERNKNTFRNFVEYSVTLKDLGLTDDDGKPISYATIYTPIDVVPDGCKAYAVTGLTPKAVLLTEKTDISAGNAALIVGEPGDYTFAPDESIWEWDDWSDNMLRGTEVNTLVGDVSYVLSMVDGKVGFYMADMNYDENGDKTEAMKGMFFRNNAFKAYLPLTMMAARGASRCLTFDFGTETGITEIENGNVKTEHEEIFDLSGRRVQKAQKGIYVVNGKVVIK